MLKPRKPNPSRTSIILVLASLKASPRAASHSQLRLDPLRLLLAEAARDQVIGIPCDRRAPASGIPGFAAGRDVTDARGLLQPVQSHVQQQGRYHAPNAIDNPGDGHPPYRRPVRADGRRGWIRGLGCGGGW